MLTCFYQGGDHVDLQKLTTSLCDSSTLERKVMTWEEMEWEVSGESVSSVEVEDEKVCSRSGLDMLLLPDLLTYQEADAACHKLGDSPIAEPRDPSDLRNLTSWYGSSLLTCKHVWTPYSDESQEGVFVNDNTGQIVE